MLVGHDVPVCPRSVPVVRYIQLSLIVLLSGAIWQILVQPSSLTARIDPMHPVIRVIPTFGTYYGCYHGLAGYKPASAKYSSQLDGADDLDR